MNCPLCDAYIPSTFNHCPACGAPINRELPKPKKRPYSTICIAPASEEAPRPKPRDMLILDGQEIPIYLLRITEHSLPYDDGGRYENGRIRLGSKRTIREFTVMEDV